MFFNFTLQKVFLVSVQRNFDMCAFKCAPSRVRDCDIRKLYERHEHVKFHARDIRGTNHVRK